MKMKSALCGLMLILVVLGIAAAGCGRSETLEERLDEIAADMVYIRGLEPESDVEYHFITSDELREMLADDLEEEYPEEERRRDQEIYVLLDLMDEEQNLSGIILDVLSEQVIGFYEEDSGLLYMVSDMLELGPMEKVTFAHEYTHALQDQHFNLSSLPLDVEDNSDLTMAVLSLVEGDAVLSQFNYMFRKLGKDDLRAVMQESMEAETGELEGAPPFIQKDLLFPYEEGLEFVMALGGWESINEAYQDPPRSTEQILHPEKYLEGEEPQEPYMPDMESVLGEGWSLLDSDVFGELYMRIYLETFVAEEVAERAAAGWGGDRFLCFENTAGDKLVILRSAWDSNNDADEFFEAYTSFAEEKGAGAWDSRLEQENVRQWEKDDLVIYLVRNGIDVLVIIAPDGSTAQKALSAFPELTITNSPCP